MILSHADQMVFQLVKSLSTKGVTIGAYIKETTLLKQIYPTTELPQGIERINCKDCCFQNKTMIDANTHGNRNEAMLKY